jgi:hypothetical protein
MVLKPTVPVSGCNNNQKQASMGSMITLGIGEMDIDWGKNNYFNDYSALFLPSDKKDIQYLYANNIIECKPGFSRPLSEIKSRLDLLGYSINNLRRIYEKYLSDYFDEIPQDVLSYDDLVMAFSTISIEGYRQNFDNYKLGESAALAHLLNHPIFESLKKPFVGVDSLMFDSETFFEKFDAHFLLRLLMENPDNLGLHLEWKTADVIEGGWVDEIIVGLSDSDKFLIVSEGSSDTFVLKQALERLRPDIVDFFTFIDMEENYPFTGTGNLYRFCQGLSSIKIQNKVLIIFDNDLEGVANYERVKRLKLPQNMGVMKLPDIECFDNFPTIGVSGESLQDINGRAVAIECFLDFAKVEKAIHRIRWTNYIKEMNNYQGSLEDKDTYVSSFKDYYRKMDYDFTKLNCLVDAVIDSCVGLVSVT